ncbi:CoA transferase [Gordonia sp. NPDC127522]|uniref:CaiB/BaiF CoA-transferase family protein n=1 Tax=Gordonia sp. NPDC127522 TaxID=3345390 RepID=UPI003643B9FA
MPTDLPLTGLFVLDLTRGRAGLSARLFADLGADVLRVMEPDSTRFGDAHTEIVEQVYNVNKRSRPIDFDSADDIAALDGMLRTCDVAFNEGETSLPAVLGLTEDEFRSRFPRLVTVTTSQFGSTGPYSRWTGTDAVHSALSGYLSRSGLPGHPPKIPPAALPTQTAAIVAAWAGLLAYHNRLVTGSGDDVEVSVLESAVQVLDPAYGMAGSATSGVPTVDGPRGRPAAGHLYPIFPCVDGHVRLCILKPRQWQVLFTWMGSPDEFADPGLSDMAARFAIADSLYPAIGRRLAGRRRQEVVEELQRLGVPAAPVLDLAEVLGAEHFAERRVFTSVSSCLGDMSVPDSFLRIDGQRVGIRPATDGFDTSVLGDRPNGDRREFSASEPTAPQRRPLEGVRVLDLGVIVVGGETGRLLADMGAEVIRVESAAFPDGSRQSLTTERISPVFAWGNRNKVSLGLDLRAERGRELFLELARTADVVLSNFKPGTMNKLGIGTDELLRVNPRLVIADSSAFGCDGPWGQHLGYGPLVRAATGFSWLWRYNSSDPDGSNVGGYCDASTIYPDHVAARVAAFGIVALLVRRHRTRSGGTVSVSQAEVILAQNADLYAAASVGLAANPPSTIRDVFPCRGDDEWVVIDIRTSGELAALRTVLADAKVTVDSAVSTDGDVESHARRIEADLAAWTLTRTPREAAEALQSAGVPAAQMNRLTELLDDEHLRARKAFRMAHHPHIRRPMPSENTPAHFRRIPDVRLEPAPLSGEHTRTIVHDLLGLDDQEVDSLIDAGVLHETIVSRPHDPSQR